LPAIPTIKVIEKGEKEAKIINLADFDAEKHTRADAAPKEAPAEEAPKRTRKSK